MKKKYIHFLVILCLIPQLAHADFKQKLRLNFEKYLGHELTIKILGEKLEKIILPAIPKVEDSAISTKVFSKNEQVDIKINPEKLKKDNLKYISEIYKVTRDGRADAKSVNNWMNALSQGGTREGLYRAVVLDSNYASLENYDYPVSDRGQDFTVSYLNKFLAKNAKKSSIGKSNFYTLKRVVTGKTLEILDEYLLNERDDLFKWYAVFSSDIAKDFPGAWKNKIRGSSNREAHYKWCKSVPIQIIKSEVIVKLHMLFNYLKD